VDETTNSGEIWYKVNRIPALIWVVYDSARRIVVEGSTKAAFTFLIEDIGSREE
jgi:hypothetical protein